MLILKSAIDKGSRTIQNWVDKKKHYILELRIRELTIGNASDGLAYSKSEWTQRERLGATWWRWLWWTRETRASIWCFQLRRSEELQRPIFWNFSLFPLKQGWAVFIIWVPRSETVDPNFISLAKIESWVHPGRGKYSNFRKKKTSTKRRRRWRI